MLKRIGKMMSVRRISFLLLLLTCIYPVRAAIQVTTSAPSAVAAGEQFRLEYTVNTQSINSAQNLSKIPGFDILYGPSKSTSYSFQSINGRQSQNSSTTFTYTLMAKKTGAFTLPGLTVNVGGRNYSSRPVRIQVVAGSSNGGRSRSSSSNANVQAVRSSSSAGRISNKDLFIKVTANKNEVYEQEPILLTYRVYARVNLTQMSGKMPDLKGFMVKEVPLPQQKTFSIGNFNNQVYYTTIWSQYVMFPQQTGKLVIPNIRFDGIVVFNDPNVDLVDAFFNGSSGSIERKKTIIAPSLTINVKPLPNKPKDFSGAVGNFNIKSILKTLHPKENETMDLQVIISGTGNVNLIKAPSLQLPSDFDSYDPKMSNNTRITNNGMVGSLVIDYLAVPKKRGKYDLPGINFTYFDTSTNSYRTIHTSPMSIDVAKGEKNIYYNEQQDILAKSDIRYIKQGNVTLSENKDVLWNRPLFWALYLIIIIIFCIAYYYLNSYYMNSSDSNRQRVKGASRLLLARMKKAKKLMQKNDVDGFYEETLKALTGYVGDKFSIPVSELTKERITTELTNASVPAEKIEDFMSLLNSCEFYRFSPESNKAASINSVYEHSLLVMNTLDNIIKKNKK